MSMRRRVSGVFLWLLAAVAAGNTQGTSHPKVLVAEHPTDKRILPCRAGTNFETDKYTIKNTTVDDPFKFLYWIGGKRGNIEAQLKEKLDNQPFRYQLVDGDALGVIEKARFTPDTKGSFAISVEVVSVENCDSFAKTLDLVYRVYSTDPPRPIAGATESQAVAERAPQTTVGLDQTGSPFHLIPASGYNRSYDVFGGGQLRYAPSTGGTHLLDALAVQGQGSASMHQVAAALSGSMDFPAWVNHAGWQLNFANDSVPAGITRLAQSTLSGQLDAQTRPFLNEAMFARFGGLLQGGNMQSALLPAGSLPPKTLASTGYGSFKSYFGISSRSSRNVLSISYGLEVGSVGSYPQVGWLKQIGDIADEWWTPIGDHKPLEVESRFTVGALQIPHAAPLGARFFAGSADHSFIPGDEWQIRDVPVIRAIPANRFYLTSQGVGADRFADINLTFSYPLKAYPIVPKELTADQEFNQLLQGQINSAAAVEQVHYASKDEHFAAATSKLPALKQQLQTLQSAVTAAQTGKAAQPPVDNCVLQVETAMFYVTMAQGEKDAAQYGQVEALLPAKGDALQVIHDSCAGGLAPALDDAAVRSAAAAVDASRAAMLEEFNAIDQKVATKKSDGDIAFARRTINTLFKDCNIYSIGPLGVFDAASIGPQKGSLGGSRIGPGGGVRVELASSATFTLGYAWNVNRQPGEGDGALFFAIGIRDLFH
jgi:hypothetical protein